MRRTLVGCTQSRMGMTYLEGNKMRRTLVGSARSFFALCCRHVTYGSRTCSRVLRVRRWRLRAALLMA